MLEHQNSRFFYLSKWIFKIKYIEKWELNLTFRRARVPKPIQMVYSLSQRSEFKIIHFLFGTKLKKGECKDGAKKEKLVQASRRAAS